MEYAGAVLSLPAVHEEMTPGAEEALIAKLTCPLIEADGAVYAAPGTRYRELAGAKSIEQFHCSYGVSPTFAPLFKGSDTEFVAHDDELQIRVFWHRTHRFFVGSLFQPERYALRGELHPLVRAFFEET